MVASRARAEAEARRVQVSGITVAEYAHRWLEELELRPLTMRDYHSLLTYHILPGLGQLPLESLTKSRVRQWYATLPKNKPRARSKALQLLHNMMNTALDVELIDTNPASLGRRSAARPARKKIIRPLTVAEVADIADAMPPRLRLAVLLGCWCALRYGELAELRRADVRPGGILRVERAVIRVNGAYVATRPKTRAGIRDIHIPPTLIPLVTQHLDEHVGQGKDALLFPATTGLHMHSPTFARHFATAAAQAGRPDATPHVLRHTGASLATAAGATTADVMARLGHTTAGMAMIYQHTLAGADARVANHSHDCIRPAIRGLQCPSRAGVAPPTC